MINSADIDITYDFVPDRSQASELSVDTIWFIDIQLI